MKHANECRVDSYIFFINFTCVIHISQNLTHLDIFFNNPTNWWRNSVFVIRGLWARFFSGTDTRIKIIPKSWLKLMNINFLLNFKHVNVHPTILVVMLEKFLFFYPHHHFYSILSICIMEILNKLITQVLIFKSNIIIYFHFNLWRINVIKQGSLFFSTIEANKLSLLFGSIFFFLIVFNEKGSSEQLSHAPKSVVVICWHLVLLNRLIKNIWDIQVFPFLLFHIFLLC